MANGSTRVPGTSGVRVLIVDDHAIVREGLVRVLEATGQSLSIGEASGGFQALDWLRSHPCDVMIVDLSMPGMTGIELIRRVHAGFPATRVLVLSMHAEEQYALRAFKAGAHGYVTKDRAAAELVEAVGRLAAGGTYVTTSLAERMVLELSGAADVPSHARLSDREMDVLRRIVAGQRMTDIAHALNLSVKTVSTQKRRIQDKLGLPSLAAMVAYGMEQGLRVDDLN